MTNTQSTANLYPLHHIAHCLSIQTFLFAFIFIRQFTPEGINGKALKITRRDDVKMKNPFEIVTEANQGVISGIR